MKIISPTDPRETETEKKILIVSLLTGDLAIHVFRIMFGKKKGKKKKKTKKGNLQLTTVRERVAGYSL